MSEQINSPFAYFLIRKANFQNYFFIINRFSKMTALKSLKSLIYQADMFCSSELLRYNSETQFKTLAGGLLSIAIICVIAGGFFDMVAGTLRRVTITSSLITTKQSNPPLVTLLPGSENMFMMGLSIQSLDLSFFADLNNGPQYFSLQMSIIQIESGVPNWTIVQMEPCRRDHWNMMPEFQQGFDSFGVGGWLCLPLDFPLPLQGTYTSPINYQVFIQVLPCNNQKSNSSCASQEEVDALFAQHKNFYLTLNYINPVINPNQQEFISYYIQGNDYVIFSAQIASQAWVYFSDYTVNTDESIWPYTHITTKKGCIVEQKAINHPYSVTQDSSFASIYLAKSSNSLVYNREVQKISAVFSYIGGLVGAVTALLFIIKSYTDSSLELSIGINLFEPKPKEGQVEQEGKGLFGFMGYIRLTFYRILKFCGWSGTSERSERLERFQKEAIQQLDVQLLIRRLIKLESCMSHLFTPEQLKQIWQNDPITLDSARKMRGFLFKDEDDKENKDLQSVSKEVDLINAQMIFEKQKAESGNNEELASKIDSSVSMQKRITIDNDFCQDAEGVKDPPIFRIYRGSHFPSLGKTKKASQFFSQSQ